jgi:alkylation response protein AidB-like acyl-CoA dehydrogenase
MASNYYLDNDDLRFHVERAFDWKEIVSLLERNYTAEDGYENLEDAKETYKDILEMVGKFLAVEVEPKVRAMDLQHPQLVDGEVKECAEMEAIAEGFKEMSLYALNVPRELGGFNAPFSLYFVLAEMISRADPSLIGHYGFHGGIAMSLLIYALKEGSIEHKGEVLLKTRFDEAIAEICEGNAFGCMVLTEPDAGSDLSAIRTKGVLGEDGIWRVTGQKIFITAGHGQYQLVLAKSENTGNGLKDLSLFLVPRKIERGGKLVNNVEIERLEEKLGINASVTATLAYDDSEGELIGERGQGFELMLMLMNNARLGVAFEGIGLMDQVQRLAREYAAERKSMGKPIDKQEMIADYLDRMDTELRGLRAMAFKASEYLELYMRLETKLQLDPPQDPKERKAIERRVRKLKWKARELTPLLKYQAGEKAVEHALLSLQIHGGVGYSKEYLVEKYLRDAVVLPIYEGTSQIQALMALKDQMQNTLKDPAGFVRKVAQARLASISSRDPLERKLARLEVKQYGAIQHILTRIARDKWNWVSEKKITQWPNAFLKDWDAKRDFSFGLLHAERLTRILTEVSIARILVEQGRRFPERLELADKYMDRAASVVNTNLDEILHTGDRLLRELAEEQTQAAEEAKSA